MQDWIVQVDSLNRGGLGGIKDATFSIPCGGIHGLLGAEGSGKTILLDILSGYVAPDEGTVCLAGEQMMRKNKALRARVGYIPAKPSFYGDMTVLETLNFVGDTRGVPIDKRYRQMDEAVELLGLRGIENQLTEGLSVEQKKRLSFAAALLGNTELLLLDEPLLGISEESHAEIISLLELLGKHKTLFLASRSYALVSKLCEDILVLSDGMVVAQDTLAHLDKSTYLAKNISFEDFYYEMSGKKRENQEMPDGDTEEKMTKEEEMQE